MGVPPVIVTLAFDFAAGEDDLDDGFESESSRPAAEGGSFGVGTLDGPFELLAGDVVAASKASGPDCSARAFASGVSFRDFDDSLALM
jgi:hypothetical protein